MLGIAVNDRKGPRRTRSTSGLSLSAASPATGPGPSERPVSGTSFGGRPASLPGTPGLTEVYNVMTAEVRAFNINQGIIGLTTLAAKSNAGHSGLDVGLIHLLYINLLLYMSTVLLSYTHSLAPCFNVFSFAMINLDIRDL